MPPEVQCKTCGYLAVRRKQERDLVEVEEGMRERGEFPGAKMNYLHIITPVCFVREHNLDEPWQPDLHNPAPVHEFSRFVEIVSKNRTCKKHTPWIQGYSPKEHHDMIREERLLEYERQRDEWQRKCVEDDRDWRERQAIRDREWRREDRHTLGIQLIIVFVVGVIGTIGTLIAAGRWPWPWFHN